MTKYKYAHLITLENKVIKTRWFESYKYDEVYNRIHLYDDKGEMVEIVNMQYVLRFVPILNDGEIS